MGNKNVPNNLSRYSFLIIIIISVLVLSYVVKNPLSSDSKKITYSKFLEEAGKEGAISEVKYMDTQAKIEGKFKNGDIFTVSVPKESKSLDDVIARLSGQGATVSVEPPGFKENFGSILYMIVIPALFFVGLWFLIMRQANVGGSQAMSFGRSRAKLLQENQVRVTFKDVAGVDEAKEELEEVIEFLKDPKRFQELGAKIPKGMLLVGPPGSGKTLLARAVAGEARVPFFHMSGSDFVEMFVGVGASRVRDLFEQAKKSAPCLVFIDEIDAVGRQRGAGLGGGHDEREQTLNQLLVEMDGFAPNVGVLILAATNRPDVLDPALLRPGRFDRRVVVDRPDVTGRKAILEVHARDKKLAPDADLEIVARRTPGFTGADLENVMNEAALLSARRNDKVISQEAIEEAIERNIAGPERKSRLITEKARKITAYHEAGHALVARLLPDTDPVHKISILPRGMALGYTLQLPLEDKYMTTKSELLDNICVLLGGRMAEEMVFGKDQITTGASNDLEKVKKIARKMVCEFGMSENLGPLTFGDKEENVFLGRALAEGRDYSEDVAFQIDQEIRKIVDRCYKKTEKLLKEHFERLQLVTDKLLEKECLDGVLLESLLDGRDMADDEVKRLEAVRKSEREKERKKEIEEDRIRREGPDAGPAAAQPEAASAEQDAPAPDEAEPVAAILPQDQARNDLPVFETEIMNVTRAVQSMDGLLARFSTLLLDTFNSEYRPRLSDAACSETFREADEQFFQEKDFKSAIESLQASIRKCRDNKLVPGLRILMGLAYFQQGNIERLSDELMAALMAAPATLEKNVERLLVSAISYFRILNEELKKNNLTIGRLPEDPDAVRVVETRYREWEQRTGYHISADISST